MLLLLILCAIVLILTMITVFAISVGGSVFIIIFGDVIVCIMFLIWLIKKLCSRKKRK